MQWQTEEQARWYVEDGAYVAEAERTPLLERFQDFRFGNYDWDYQAAEAKRARQTTKIAPEIQRVMREFNIGLAQNVFILEGPNGTGKNHLAWALIRWLAINRGYTSIEHCYFPEWALDRLEHMTDEDEINWMASILFLDDLDSGAAISASSQNPWLLRHLLARLRPRIDTGRVLTVITLNTGLGQLEAKLAQDSRGQQVEGAKGLARALVSSINRATFGRTTFYGREYYSPLEGRTPGPVSVDASQLGFWGRL